MPATRAASDATAAGRALVSVLVPALNEASNIDQAVAAMLAQQVDGQVELLFADGGSNDGTRERLRELAAVDSRIRVLDNPRGWTPSGLNVCLSHARGEYVARMDAHTLYPDNYLRSGIDRLRAGGAEWVSGPQVVEGEGRVQRAFAVALQSPLGRGGSRRWAAGRNGAEALEWELDSGVFTGVWRREKVLEVGGWDERWWRNQDSEMAARFLERGSRLICLADMAARYVPRDSLRALARQYDGYGFYRAATARRHPDTLRRSALLMPSLVLCWLAAVVAPRRLRRFARLGVALYVATIAAAGVKAGRDNPPEVAATVPAVLAAMHFGSGVGFLRGMVKFGTPWAALARVSGIGALERLAPDPGSEPVYAPSLDAS
ncbi:MAG TPA: glycosyltransferase [Solirubrobacteraceae bacterium]|jgi:glycosyltransferase involved in cell wall biosynthesis